MKEVFKTPDQFPRIVIDIKGITESIVPIIGVIDAPDSDWNKLRDSIKK